MLQTTSTLLLAYRSWISFLPSTSPVFTSRSYNQLPPKIGRKKEGFKEILDRVEELDYDDPEFVELCDESEQLEELAHGFRHSALSTQLKQDRHLVLYQRWTKAVFGDVDDEDLDQACFPDLEDGARPLRKLFSQMRRYLAFVSIKCIPRAAEDPAISCCVSGQYQRSLSFSVKRKYAERDIEPPSDAVAYRSLTEMIRYLNQRLNIKLRRQTIKNDTRVGTW
ncbi:hypothetical protein BKA56DRAFT_617995 [Ilyonectria sp. MPI-CAGE-AT-0026]|nr:hypothetical protein BKA56DRAFT_617995 [Ilyonectria sp. MPI-CAGE-AT-0026]